MEKCYDELRVRLRMERMGNDLCVMISGGDAPHIGSVAIAEPRESLRRDGSRSATISTFNFIGHKDDEIANAVARAVAAQANCRTVVLCGLHYEKIDSEKIAAIHTLTERMIHDILAAFSNQSDPEV